MGQHLARQPLFLTLAQVRHATVQEENFNDKIKSLKAKMERAGYPDQSTRLQSRVQHIITEQGIQIQNESLVIHEFRSKDRKHLFEIDGQAITYSTAKYENRNLFLDACKNIFDIALKHLEPAYLERIGMRMLDAIQPRKSENETLSSYLSEKIAFVAASSEESEKLIHRYMEWADSIREYQRIRKILVVSSEGLVLPPDISPHLTVELEQRFKDYPKAIQASIDTDISRTWPREKPYNKKMLTNWLTEMKDLQRDGFLECVSPKGLKLWD
jgi:uncharacterized protein (TIGR04255 family)